MPIQRSVKQEPEKSAPSSPVTNYGEPLALDPTLRMLLIGDTGSGKTSQIGLVAEYIKATEDKDTILWTMDKGGFQPIRPYIEMGIIVPVIYDGVTDPWIWISHAVRGELKVGGKWVKDNARFGLAGHEGLTAYAEKMLMNLSEDSARNPGSAVGGESAWTFTAKGEGGEKLAIASNTMSHYGLAQLRIMMEIWEADPGIPSIWTAILGRTQDPTGGGGLLSAQTVGKAQGASLPRWFDYTFRLDARPVEGGSAKHVLYLTTHLDKHSKGAKVIANARLPLAGETSKVDAVIDPADMVKALLQIRRRNVVAKDAIAERIARIRGLKG